MRGLHREFKKCIKELAELRGVMICEPLSIEKWKSQYVAQMKTANRAQDTLNMESRRQILELRDWEHKSW